MSLVHGPPKSVTLGLLLYVDAANTKSYPGAGGIWTDISENNYTATVNNPQTFSTTYGGGILTPADQTTTFVSMPVAALRSLPDGNIWTMEWTLTVLSIAGARYGPHMTISGGNEFIWVYDGTTLNSFLFGYSTRDLGSDLAFALNVPMMITLTKNGTIYRAYKNGTFTGQYTGNAFDAKLIQSWVLDQEQDGIGTSFDPNQNLHANWHNVKLYGRILADSEIQQNFNAIRWRYGL